MWIILDFKCLYCFEKRSMIFQKFLTKSLIHKIKEHKNFQNFLTRTDRRNWKENVKNIRKIKKQIINCGFLKKIYFTYLYFCKRTFRNFQNLLIKSLFHRLKYNKNFDYFLTSLDRWNRKKDAKNDKRINNK